MKPEVTNVTDWKIEYRVKPITDLTPEQEKMVDELINKFIEDMERRVLFPFCYTSPKPTVLYPKPKYIPSRGYYVHGLVA